MKKLMVFDLDGTLAASKEPVDKEMAGLLVQLLSVLKVAIISGGDWPQFETQVIAKLPRTNDLANLSILPTTGTKFFRFGTEWEQLYAENFSAIEREKISSSLLLVAKQSNLGIEKLWGNQIENRGSQITFSALGQKAPGPEKAKFDPDFAKRKRMQTALEKLLPNFSVRLGGTTSIDVTGKGIDKAYGINKLRDILGIVLDDMLYVGDAIFPGGNDYAAKQAGVATVQVKDPQETKKVIETVIACLGPAPQKAVRS